MTNNYACIILAAGASTRFGSAKMHYRLDGQQPMLLQTLQQYRPVFESIYVVIQQEDEYLASLLTTTSVGAACQLVKMSQAIQSMSASIKQGLTASAHHDGWLIALGDMPLIQTSTIQTIMNHSQPNNIVVPYIVNQDDHYQQGHPVFFGYAFREQLLKIQGDQGAKLVIENNKSHLIKVTVCDSGVITDFDTKPI